MYYYGARWYDPTIGRFISGDPFAGRRSNPQSLNPYIYVLDIPTSLTDPSGENPLYIDLLESLGPENSVINIAEHVTGINMDQTVENVLGPQRGDVFVGSRVLSGGAFLASGIVAAGAIIAPIIGIGGSSLGTGAASTACAGGGCQDLTDLATKDLVTSGEGPGGALPNQIGAQGVKATINSLGQDFIGTEAPVYSENYGFGRIDMASTDKLIEVKNVQNLYLTNENEIQLLKYVDAVGPENLQYDIYANYVQPRFTAALEGLGVDYRIFPYIPLP